MVEALSKLRPRLSRRRLTTRSHGPPWGTATEFVAEAIRRNLLIIPGNVFSKRDTHFRISYAVDDKTLTQGLEILREMAGTPVTQTSLSRAILSERNVNN